MKRLPPGRVMLDVAGTELQAADRQRLQHRACAGVILFGRNYENPEQLRALCDEIKSLREPPLMIAVDQEGGRVQRFRNGFTAIPAMREIGLLWDKDKEQGAEAARDAALVIGTELSAAGIDFSFAPVLDLDYGQSSVIGDRAFHASPQAVTELATAFISGLNTSGMAAVGKHFPGHGAIVTDTHHEIAVDSRALSEIEGKDLRPFTDLCPSHLAGVMPAHVIYSQADNQPAGFSRFWLQEMLRKRMQYQGIIFSDDLSMHGASGAGDVPARARAAIAAGCDIALVCNDPDNADAVLESIDSIPTEADVTRMLTLQRKSVDTSTMDANERYARARGNIGAFGTNV